MLTVHVAAIKGVTNERETGKGSAAGLSVINVENRPQRKRPGVRDYFQRFELNNDGNEERARLLSWPVTANCK